jgi:2'-5' RNA ligase
MTMRTFIALELPPQAVAAAGSVAAELKKTGADVKWVRPENLHVTLKFLGEVDQDQIEPICRSLDRACQERRALRLSLNGCGAFPNRGRPQVVWLGLDGEVQEMSDLAQAVEQEMNRLGFAPEKRSFKPHLTLGRLRRGKARGKRPETAPLSRALAGRIDYTGPDFMAQNVTLMQSRLTPQGAIYDPLYRKTLA